MKPSTLVLALSLGANAALLGLFALQPALAPPVIRDFFTSDAQRNAEATAKNEAAAARTAAQAKAAVAKRSQLWASLQADDLKSLVARLKAAGFSPVVIRAIVNQRLEAQFSARMAELAGTIDLPFWKPDPSTSYNNSKYYETQSQIYRDRAKALREILGDAYFATSAGDATAEQRRKYGDLPKNKIELIERIVEDYAEMLSQAKIATNGITLPEDREKFALLEREKRADLAAILSPAELEDYEMRNSPMTMRLRQAFGILDVSEDEFRTVYRAQQPYFDILYPNNTGMTVMTSEMSRQRTEAQQKVAEQLKAAFGEQRYTEYARATNYEYQNLYRLGQSSGVSIDSINRAYDLRDSVTKESMRINDSGLSADARLAALNTLVGDTKMKLVAALGSNVADAYTKNLSWLNAIERGYAVRVSPDGSGMSYMMSSSPRPPATPSTPAPVTTTPVTTTPTPGK